jgi:hypothetical protein
MIDKELAEFLLQENQPMIIAKFDPANRQERRAMEKEYDSIIKHLLNTECNFLNQLFSEDDGNSYEDLYTFYHNQYANNAKYANNVVKPRFVDINEFYFCDTYKPQV